MHHEILVYIIEFEDFLDQWHLIAHGPVHKEAFSNWKGPVAKIGEKKEGVLKSGGEMDE